MTIPVEIKVLGGGREVGRVSIAISSKHSDSTIILDAGINFDEDDRPVFANHYPPRKVKAIVLSHGHLDHIGSAPLYFISNKIDIFMTRPTLEISKLMLEDFLKLSGYYSPYERREIAEMQEAAKTVEYGSSIEIEKKLVLEFYSAGHIPGSLFTIVDYYDTRIGFTGDINTVETKLVKPAQIDEIRDIDILITEATYGSATHPPRRHSQERLYSIIDRVIDKGGTVLIPAFSVARGQEVMMILVEKDWGVPIYVDGMIRQVADIFLRNKEFINNPNLLEKAYREFNIVKGWQDRRRAWKESSIIIASAGMLKGGPSLYYLKKIGYEPNNAVVLVSYQVPGSHGRRLLEEGLMPQSTEPLRAQLEWLDLSSHADKKGLLEIIERTKPRKVLIVHSDSKTGDKFREEVQSLGFVEEVITAENDTSYYL